MKANVIGFDGERGPLEVLVVRLSDGRLGEALLKDYAERIQTCIPCWDYVVSPGQEVNIRIKTDRPVPQVELI